MVCLLTLSTFTFLACLGCNAEVSRGIESGIASPRKANMDYSLTIFLSPGPESYLICTYAPFIFCVRCDHPHCHLHLLTLDLSCVPLSPTAWLTQSTEGHCTRGVHSFSAQEGHTNVWTRFSMSPFKSEPNRCFPRLCLPGLSSVLLSCVTVAFPISYMPLQPPFLHAQVGPPPYIHTGMPTNFYAGSRINSLQRILL